LGNKQKHRTKGVVVKLQKSVSWKSRSATFAMGLVAATLAFSLTPHAASAQSKPLETTAGWKQACETSPGNRVVVTEDITISMGATASSPEQITTGCVIEMINDADVQLDKVGLSFAGPVTILGGLKSGLAMQEAYVTAPSISLNLPGDESFIRTSFSRLNASAGDLTINLGRIAKLELFRYRTAGTFGNVTNGTFFATGNLKITAGERFNLAMVEAVMYGGASLTIETNGFETNLKAENTSLEGRTGSMTIIGRGGKMSGEFSNSTLRAGGDLDVVAGSTESNLNFSNVQTRAGARVQLYTAGAKGNVNVSNGSVQAGQGIFVSAIGAEGSVNVENGSYSGGNPTRFVTGAQGKTLVKGATITSSGLVDIQTDRAAGGVCEALENRITAPTQQLCP
jgi:hypothetical protein